MSNINFYWFIIGISLFVILGIYKYFKKQKWDGMSAIVDFFSVFGLTRILLEGIIILLYTLFDYSFFITDLTDLKENILLGGAILILISLYVYKKMLGIDIFKE